MIRFQGSKFVVSIPGGSKLDYESQSNAASFPEPRLKGEFMGSVVSRVTDCLQILTTGAVSASDQGGLATPVPEEDIG